MNIILSAFLLLILRFILCAPSSPRPELPPGVTDALARSYSVDFTTNEEGGCMSYEAKLTTAYQQMLDLAWAGESAMDDLRQPMPPKSELQQQNDWKRKADTFYALFGIRIPKQGWQTYVVPESGPATGDEFQTFIYVHFRRMRTEHLRPVGSPNIPYFLKCTDNWLKYLTLDEDDPTDPRQPPRKIHPEAMAQIHNEPGVYYAASAPGSPPRYWWWLEGFKPNQDEPMCGDNVEQAEAFPEPRGIVFCKQVFSLDTWNIDLSVGRGVNMQRFDGSIATVWLHEVAHMLMKWNDQTVKNKLGTKQNTVYGWNLSVRLAKKASEKARKSPDNYAFFAMAMYYPEFWWVTGSAQRPSQVLQQARKLLQPRSLNMSSDISITMSNVP